MLEQQSWAGSAPEHSGLVTSHANGPARQGDVYEAHRWKQRAEQAEAQHDAAVLRLAEECARWQARAERAEADRDRLGEHGRIAYEAYQREFARAERAETIVEAASVWALASKAHSEQRCYASGLGELSARRHLLDLVATVEGVPGQPSRPEQIAQAARDFADGR